jgi:serine/threonine-protein kinase
LIVSSPPSTLVLPEDLKLVPVKDLPPQIRQRLLCDDDAYAISRPLSRVPTKVIDAQSARLLEEFRKPKTVVQAILDYSRARNTDPEETLAQAHPLLRELAAARFLVPGDSELVKPIEPTLKAGARFGSYEILECANIVSDTELYRARDEDERPVALKLCRRDHARVLLPLFEHEARILEHLEGRVGPRLIERGILEEHPYLAMEWIDGRPVVDRAAELRNPEDAEANRALLDLCHSVLAAYGELHRCGILHSDIHPGNVLLNDTGEIRLIDFGLARFRQGDEPWPGPPRGGVPFFLEPEYAEAYLDRAPIPPPTEFGEQYGLAALCYLLITGTQYLDFALDQQEMMKQITIASPQSFEAAGFPSWPEIESAIFKALAKRPRDRHASVSAFAQALKEASGSIPRPSGFRPRLRAPSSVHEDFLQKYLARVRPGGELYERGFPSPPYSSVNYGAAGLAYALYRMSCLHDDPALLSLSDVWAVRASARMDSESAFYNPEMQLERDLLGPNALYHTASGVHLTATLIALAQDDQGSAFTSAHSFMQAVSVPTDNLDVTLGQSGALLGCSMLHEVAQFDGLRDIGDRIAAGLWKHIDDPVPIPESTLALNLGVAHGWAGLLYAALRWHRTSGLDLPNRFEARLQELADRAEPAGRGARWAWTDPGASASTPGIHMPGWCNGSTGFVFLWALAFEESEEPAWLQLAERAGYNAWEGAGGAASLCCGSAGSAYALLRLHRLTGDPGWRDRARKLVDYAMRGVVQLGEHPDSLYKGELGLALLISEMSYPEEARMPFFEHEGWPPTVRPDRSSPPARHPG